MSDLPIRSRAVVSSEPIQENTGINISQTLSDDTFKAYASDLSNKTHKVQVSSDFYDDAEKKLIAFVEEQISKMKDNVLFNGREPSFYELSIALSTYETVAIGLTSLYVTVRSSLAYAEEKYDDFFAEKFIEERQARKTSLGKDYGTTKEVEYSVRDKYMVDLAKLKAETIMLDNQRSMIERLIKNWDSYQYILGTLSANARSEASASRSTSGNNPNEF